MRGNLNHVMASLLIASAVPQIAVAQSNAEKQSNTEKGLNSSDSQQSELMSLSMQMAEIGYSDDILDRQMKAATEQLAEGFKKDPDMAKMEEEYNGITDFMITAMMPPIYDGTIASLPDIRLRLSEIYAANFNAKELSNLLAFYRSPTGTKLVNGMIDDPDFSTIIDEVVAGDENVSVSEEAVAKASENSALKVLKKDMTKADELALVKLSKTPEFAKLTRVSPLINAEVTKWMNEPMPEAEAEAERLVVEAVEEYMDARDNGREPKMPVYVPLGN